MSGSKTPTACKSHAPKCSAVSMIVCSLVAITLSMLLGSSHLIDLASDTIKVNDQPSARHDMALSALRATTVVHSKVNITTIFNVQSSRYHEWQSILFASCWQQSAQAGELLRLLSAPSDDRVNISLVPTFRVPHYPLSMLPGDPYSPMNKPYSVNRWLHSNKVANVDYVVLLDPDTCLTRPLAIPWPSARGDRDHVAVVDGDGIRHIVRPGRPIAQTGYMATRQRGFKRLVRRYCRHRCSGEMAQPLAVPIVIHVNDLAKITPDWIRFTRRIRRDKSRWLSDWKSKHFALEWTTEMFGYVLAAARHRIRHTVSSRLQDIPCDGKDDKVVNAHIAPVIHYPRRCKTRKTSGSANSVSSQISHDRNQSMTSSQPSPSTLSVRQQQWSKTNTDAATDFPNPNDADLDPAARFLFTALDRVQSDIASLQHGWDGSDLEYMAAHVQPIRPALHDDGP